MLLYCIPPCATATRARDRPVPRRLVARGWPDAPRLRSDSQPAGTRDLLQRAPRDVLRVRRENDTADFMGALLSEFGGGPVAVAVENPRRSYLWACGLEAGMVHPTAKFVD